MAIVLFSTILDGNTCCKEVVVFLGGEFFPRGDTKNECELYKGFFLEGNANSQTSINFHLRNKIKFHTTLKH
jgi:hypothetical protein